MRCRINLCTFALLPFAFVSRCTCLPPRRRPAVAGRGERYVPLFGPDGAAACSRGWSGAAALRPGAQPVENGTQENRFFFILFSPRPATAGLRRGEGGVRSSGKSRCGVTRPSLIRPACRHFLRPAGAGVSITHLFHGLRSARLQRAELHPWLQAVAPSGLIRIGYTAGQGRPWHAT